MPLTFQKPALVKFNNTSLTDEGRNPLGITTERIEKSIRVASGKLRKFYVATKHSFTIEYIRIPSQASKTIDGFWGGEEIKSFYDSNSGEFTLTVANRDGTSSNYTVVFTAFDWSIEKRYTTEYWNITIELEEV